MTASDPLENVMALLDASKAILKRHDEKQPMWGGNSTDDFRKLRAVVKGWESNVEPVQRLLGAARCIYDQHIHSKCGFKPEGWMNLRDAIALVEKEARIFLVSQLPDDDDGKMACPNCGNTREEGHGRDDCVEPPFEKEVH